MINNRPYLLLLLCCAILLPGLQSAAQVVDTLQKTPIDSLSLAIDSLQQEDVTPGNSGAVEDTALFKKSIRPVLTVVEWKVDTTKALHWQILQHHPYFNFSDRAVSVVNNEKVFSGKEALFYVIIGLLLFFAFLKTVFAKYFADFFRVFFRTTMKQRQIKDQLVQSFFPSLLFTIFFVLSAGLYIVFLIQYFEKYTEIPFWQLYLYTCIALVMIYTVKFITLKLFGLLFHIGPATDSYIFIVFSINKALGLFLLPFLAFLAFTEDPVYSVAIVLSWCGIVILLVYRLILAAGIIRNEVKLNLFHFVLYLLSFEVLPLLLIYKLLLEYYQ